jgi:hypothetical protein
LEKLPDFLGGKEKGLAQTEEEMAYRQLIAGKKTLAEILPAAGKL